MLVKEAHLAAAAAGSQRVEVPPSCPFPFPRPLLLCISHEGHLPKTNKSYAEEAVQICSQAADRPIP